MADRRVVYNSRFRNENPYNLTPKTTKWRHKKKQKLAEKSIENIPVVHDDDTAFTQVTDMTDAFENNSSSTLTTDVTRDRVPPHRIPNSVSHSTSSATSSVANAGCLFQPFDISEPQSTSLNTRNTENFTTSPQKYVPAANAFQDDGAVNDNSGVEQMIEQYDSEDVDFEFPKDSVTYIYADDSGDDNVDESEGTCPPAEESSSEATKDCDEQVLFTDCPLTVSESVLLTVTFALRHDLTGECLADLLTLIELHCPRPNLCKTSLYFLKKHFASVKTPLVYHKFCSGCGLYIGQKEKVDSRCGNDFCRKDLSVGKNVSYFIEVSIVEQLRNFFKRETFHSDLMHRFTRTSEHGNIEDIYDGEIYKHHAQAGGFLSEINNFSLFWYTDGAQPFKSSKGSLWPVYFVINELPYSKRMNSDNMLYAGLWFGDGKPCMSTYLKPISEVLNMLWSTGVDVPCTHCDTEINIKLLLLGGTCDLPAKAAVLNMTQFNGEFGCPKCKQPGKVVTSGRGHARVFPFDSENVDRPLREQKESIKFSIEALEKNKIICGIRGPSWFANLRYHDLIKGTAIDYMHGVLLGPVRKLLHLWFDSKYSREPFSISKMSKVVDKRLLSIKPPNFITRLPRSIISHMAYWKANECRAWLFFYSVPVLYRILPGDYYQHHLLLVEAMFILNKSSISPEQLHHAKNVLIQYCMLYETLYGLQHMTINIHQLLHIVDVVKQLGPLWVYSCFTFESTNGKLLKFIHGGSKPLAQIANAVSTMLQIPHMGEKLDSEGRGISTFYQHLRKTGSRLALGEEICDRLFALGKMKLVRDSKTLEFIASQLPDATDVFSFLRVLKNGIIICGTQYTQSKERNSCVGILHSDGSVVQIQKFLKVKRCSCLTIKCPCQVDFFALVKKFDVMVGQENKLCCDDVTHIELSNIKVLSLPLFPHLSLVCLADIKDICVYIEIDSFSDRAFVAMPPNYIEGD